jgi:cytochrome c
MDSLEVNKAAAAVLVAGIAFFLSGLIGDTLVHPTPLKQVAIKIDVPAPPGAAPPAADPPIEALLASADPAKGQALTQQVGCVACHSFNQGGKNGIGPNLYNVVGEEIAQVDGYTFSAALKAHTGKWTYPLLNEWLKKPAAFAPGTKMTFAGVANPEQRANIIAYLHTLSATPVPYPPAPPPSAAAAAPAGEDIKTLLASADPKAGQADTMKLGCVACHSFNEGGKNGLGPNLYNVVGEEIAQVDGYTFSSALKAHTGKWTFELLNQWLTKPAAFAPGTKMTFAGIPDAKTRADVIDYLHTLSANPEPLP